MTSSASPRIVEHEVGTHGEVRIGAHHGQVRVVGIDGDVARVEIIGSDQDLDRFTVESGPGRLSVAPSQMPLGGPLRAIRLGLGIGFGRAPELEVHIPRGASLEVDTTSGDIHSGGLERAQTLRTVSGSIMIERAAGSIRAESVSGDVRLVDGGSIGLAAGTVSGEVDIRAKQVGRLEVNTMSGGVRIDGAVRGPGPHVVETVSGDLLIRAQPAVRVQAQTLAEGRFEENGRVRRSGGSDGANVVQFRSMSGRCRVVTLEVDRTAGVMPGDETPRDGAPHDGVSRDGTPRDEARLEVLRALERGEVDVDEATRRLAVVDGDDGR
jgi:hypothetical protein